MPLDTETSPSLKIRSGLDHPVVDGDGHLVEYMPAYLDFLKEVAGPAVAERFAKQRKEGSWYAMTPTEREEKRVWRTSWWALPAKNTLDRATAMLPDLFRARMDELGLDFSVVYTTMGIRLPIHPDQELRIASCRALNKMCADIFRPHADRMTPVAVIPMHTPQEGIEELDYAVKELGFKAIAIASHVPRPVPAVAKQAPELGRYARWIDVLALASPYDYYPFWQRCMELKVAVTSHASGMGWGTRTTNTNYIYNHVGAFGAAGDAFCKALVVGGVTHRFPDLTFAFLEGGVTWAVDLYNGLVGHVSKRNRHAIQTLNPDVADMDLLRKLFRDYGKALMQRTGGAPETLGSAQMGGWSREDPAMVDEMRLAKLEKVEDLRRLFEPNFYFGCEADDRLVSLAFDSKKLPFGAKLKPLFSSDIGHWDVPDLREVLEEAHELLDDGLIDEAEFREFTFVNPALLHARMNPDFFKGTAVEDQVAKLLKEEGAKT